METPPLSTGACVLEKAVNVPNNLLECVESGSSGTCSIGSQQKLRCLMYGEYHERNCAVWWRQTQISDTPGAQAWTEKGIEWFIQDGNLPSMV